MCLDFCLCFANSCVGKTHSAAFFCRKYQLVSRKIVFGLDFLENEKVH